MNDRWRILESDALVALDTLEENSVDSIVADLPSGSGFMGFHWDKKTGLSGVTEAGAILSESLNPLVKAKCLDKKMAGYAIFVCDLLAKSLRVAKPGCNSLWWSFGKTQDLVTLAARVAGWEILGPLPHLCGQGMSNGKHPWKSLPESEAEKWKDWHFVLSTKREDWIWLRNPLDGTFRDNILKWGCGPIHVGAWRRDDCGGRWPANVILSHSVGCTKEECSSDCLRFLLDQQSGVLVGNRKSGGVVRKTGSGHVGHVYGTHTRPVGTENTFYSDEGGAARFFPGSNIYPGLEVPFVWNTRNKSRDVPGVGENPHPCIKPRSLMEKLVTLVTPTDVQVPGGGLVLDPVCGSGSTGEAALNLGFRFIGIEEKSLYADFAKQRLAEFERRQSTTWF